MRQGFISVEGGHRIGICGQVVENELYLPLLIGLGLDQYSIEENKIQETRTKIHELCKDECKELVEEILQMRTIEDMERKLKQFIKN